MLPLLPTTTSHNEALCHVRRVRYALFSLLLYLVGTQAYPYLVLYDTSTKPSFLTVLTCSDTVFVCSTEELVYFLSAKQSLLF